MNFLNAELSPRIAYLMVGAAASIWGMLWWPMRVVADLGVPPMWVNAFFLLLPAMTLGVFGWRSLINSRAHWRAILAVGVFIGGGFVLYSLGIIIASVSKTTVLFYLTPIWATVFGLFVLGESLTLQRVSAIVLALLGCGLVMQVNPLNIAFEKVDLLGLGSGLLWGIGSVIIRRFPDIPYLSISFAQYVIGSLIAISAALILDVPFPPAETLVYAIPISFLFAVVVLLPSVLVILRVSQYVSPGLVAILMLSEVLVAVVSSWWLLGETLSVWQWGGVIAILATGVWLGLSANDEAPAKAS